MSHTIIRFSPHVSIRTAPKPLAWLVGAFALGIVTAVCGTTAIADEPPTFPGLVVREFVYDSAPFAQCHASTICETNGGLVAAWFGGTREGHADVGIWFSRHDGKAWSPPVEVANGVQSESTRHPCWNPVLFQASRADAPLVLYYKIGPSPSRWWGMAISSADGGKTWTPPRRLPDGILGPVKNKPVELADGTLLCGSSSEHDGWRVHMERTRDSLEWTKTEPLNDGKTFAAIQPTILRHGTKLQILCRTKHGKIAESWSDDDGRTWTAPEATGLPNNNSGIDGVTLKDGRSALVYNHTTSGRTPLNLAFTTDGRNWSKPLILENEPGEYSYPAIIQTKDGRLHITWTWKRTKVRHVVVDPKAG